MSADVFTQTESSYDAVAAEYAEKFSDEMSHKPFDRAMLKWLVERVGTRGLICDLGCGPGQIAAYLQSLGAEACGIDLSPEMVVQARRLFPDIPFQQGNMVDLASVADESFAGVAAFYSIIHVPRESLVEAFSAIFRVLKPEGLLLVTFHIGDETRHLDEWWSKPVNLDFNFLQPEPIKANLIEAGFVLSEVIERDPYPPEVEVQTRRAYIFARKVMPAMPAQADRAQTQEES